MVFLQCSSVTHEIMGYEICMCLRLLMISVPLFNIAVQQGGTLTGESEAMYLFSDDAFTKDTTR